MANFKLQSIFSSYNRLFGMTAEVYNENGDLLDSIDINNSRKRVSFSFDKDDALLGNNRSDVTIKLIDDNGDAHNFKRGRSAQFDLDDDEQTFTTSISSRKRRQRMRIRPSTQKLDNEGPVFSSGNAESVDENVDPGSLVYDADASDASAVSYALNSGDSASFSIDPQTGEVTINDSPDFETKSSYSFNVVATDARGNTSTQEVTVSINDIEEGKTIQLSPLLDEITANDLSRQNDVIKADLGTLGVDF